MGLLANVRLSPKGMTGTNTNLQGNFFSDEEETFISNWSPEQFHHRAPCSRGRAKGQGRGFSVFPLSVPFSQNHED